MYSGSMVYETPQGTRTFGPGSGGLVNANVLHSTRNLPGTKVVSWIHLFEPSLLGGSVGSRIEQKYLAPITANPALELLALDPADPDQAALLEKLRDSFALDENEFGYELRLRAALGEIWLGLLALPRPEARPARRRSMKSAKRCWSLCMNITPSRCVLSRSPRQALQPAGSVPYLPAVPACDPAELPAELPPADGGGPPGAQWAADHRHCRGLRVCQPELLWQGVPPEIRLHPGAVPQQMAGYYQYGTVKR